MYPLMGILVIMVGTILLITAKKIAKNNRGSAIGISIVSVCLIVAGFATIYLLLSGKLILPLSMN